MLAPSCARWQPFPTSRLAFAAKNTKTGHSSRARSGLPRLPPLPSAIPRKPIVQYRRVYNPYKPVFGLTSSTVLQTVSTWPLRMSGASPDGSDWQFRAESSKYAPLLPADAHVGPQIWKPSSLSYIRSRRYRAAIPYPPRARRVIRVRKP